MKSVSPSLIGILCLLCAAGTGILTFLMMKGLSLRRVPEQYIALRGMVRERALRSSGYEALSQWLIRNGCTYHFGRRTGPVSMFAISLSLSVSGGIILLRISPVAAVLGGAALAVLPWGLLIFLNRRDNERMLPDLHLIYHSLAMQIRSGIYVTDALAEVYPSVREQRLRDALLSLAGDLVMKSDLYRALDAFQEKFDNRQIDSLCIIVIQALESGRAVDLLNDITEQIKDMETAVLTAKKGHLDRSLTFYQLAMLTAVLIVAVYACIGYLLTAASLI